MQLINFFLASLGAIVGIVLAKGAGFGIVGILLAMIIGLLVGWFVGCGFAYIVFYTVKRPTGSSDKKSGQEGKIEKHSNDRK